MSGRRLQLPSLAEFEAGVARLHESNKEREEEVVRENREREQEVKQTTKDILTIEEREELQKQVHGRTKERYAAIEKLHGVNESSKQEFFWIQVALDVAIAAKRASKVSRER